MMAPRTYTEQYFANQSEQARIKSALTAAIPAGVTFYNLVIALTDMTREWAHLAFADEVMHYPPPPAETESEQ